MFIRNTELLTFHANHTVTTHIADLCIRQGLIVAIGSLSKDILSQTNEPLIEAKGSVLLPGLIDHHAHFMSYAASLHSLPCGPPEVNNESCLIQTLNGFTDGDTWLRGIAYHESVAGNIDRAWLDRYGPNRPLRIQHRSGRLWIFNSYGLELCLANPRLSAVKIPLDGRLFDQDADLSQCFQQLLLPVDIASQQLAAYGIIGFNDMTPTNHQAQYHVFQNLQHQGKLLQKVRLSGCSDLAAADSPRLTIGNSKVHLHDSDLPEFDQLCQLIMDSHQQGKGVAIHCVTEVALVFALAALQTTGTIASDRIEHASVTTDEQLRMLQDLRLTVVTQPNFIHERGDAYLKDISFAEQDELYRAASFLNADVPLAFATDMPFGHPDPWLAMQTAITRLTAKGAILGANESVSPETAVALFIDSLEQPSKSRQVKVGAPADLCLMDCAWSKLRHDLNHRHVKLTLRDGEIIHAAMK